MKPLRDSMVPVSMSDPSGLSLNTGGICEDETYVRRGQDGCYMASKARCNPSGGRYGNVWGSWAGRLQLLWEVASLSY